MSRARHFPLVLLSLLLLTASIAVPVHAQTGETVPRFEPAACMFTLPDGQVEGETVECGYLVVPEDRANPAGRLIRLAVAIFRAASASPQPDPVIYLDGGPGSGTLAFLRFNFAPQFAPLLAEGDRDLILFDQRGVGLSEPALDCPAYDALLLDTLDFAVDGRLLTPQDRADLTLSTLEDCGAMLSTEADLAAYNTQANAADVDDLRRALGYEQVNLWGISYGTRLALGVLRYHPAGVRSVVLDSVFPPDVNLQIDAPGNARRAFDALFAACAADQDCAATYPDLEARFWATVERLNADPAPLAITHARTGEAYPALLDGDTLVGALFRLLYATDFLPYLPGVLDNVAAGLYSGISQLMGLLIAQQDDLSTGMYFSVQCHDDIPFGTRTEFDAALAALPELAGFFRLYPLSGLATEVCAAWGAGEADPIANEAVVSDAPALLMAGEYDPITPPAWAELAAATLSNSTVHTFPGVAHGVSPSGDCPRGMMLGFLDDPATPPDDACLAALEPVAFVLPEGAPGAAVVVGEAPELEAFESAETGLRGVVPVGWTLIEPGIYLRSASLSDQTGIIVQAASVDAATMLGALSQQMNLPGVPAEVGTRVSDWFAWRLYRAEAGGGLVDLALAERDGQTAVVLLVSADTEHDLLYEAVFLPVLDALAPVE